MIRGFLLVLVGLYLLAGVGALLLIPASAGGWFGIEPDPLSAVYALLLSLPWSMLLLHLMDPGSPLVAWLICSAGIALNGGIALWLVRRLRRPAGGAAVSPPVVPPRRS